MLKFKKMKKSSCFKMMLSMVFMMVTTFALNAQNYHSKPTAITNLADESKYLGATMPTLEDSDNNAYLRAQEKQRIIKKILKAIKLGATVEEAVVKNLPSENMNQFTSAISNIPLEPGEKNKVKWIREQILPLVSY